MREHPYLFDKVAQRVQRALGDNLPWLDRVFGLAERLTRVVDGRKYVLPNIWIGGNEYIDLLPDQFKGSFAFLYLDEPQRNTDGRMRAKMNCVLWWDTRKVDAALRDRERVKSQVLDAVEATGGAGHLEVAEIYDRPESVYKGFTFDETAQYALAAPFAGLRVVMDVSVDADCNPYV